MNTLCHLLIFIFFFSTLLFHFQLFLCEVITCFWQCAAAEGKVSLLAPNLLDLLLCTGSSPLTPPPARRTCLDSFLWLRRIIFLICSVCARAGPGEKVGLGLWQEEEESKSCAYGECSAADGTWFWWSSSAFSYCHCYMRGALPGSCPHVGSEYH